MSFSKLQPELWSHILDFLAPPLPYPLSGLTKNEAIGESLQTIARLPHAGAPGTTSRGGVRSTELARLMRTSTAFNLLASKPLYNHVITDDLQGLILIMDHDIDRQLSFPFQTKVNPHPHFQTKDELLHRIRSLHLEYRNKGNRPSCTEKGDEPTYIDIMSDSFFWSAVSGPGPLDSAIEQSIIEASEIKFALIELSSRLSMRQVTFPRLHTMSIGSIFGAQEALWAELQKRRWGPDDHASCAGSEDDMFGDSVAGCNRSMDINFRLSPITHFCQRGLSGPLSLPVLINWTDMFRSSPSATSPIFTIHFDCQTSWMPAGNGHATRWILEQHGNDGDMKRITSHITSAIRTIGDHRAKQTLINPYHPIQVFASGRRITPPGTKVGNGPIPLDLPGQREMVRRFEKHNIEEMKIRAVRGTSATARDGIVWKPSADSPSCVACGWAYVPEEVMQE